MKATRLLTVTAATACVLLLAACGNKQQPADTENAQVTDSVEAKAAVAETADSASVQSEDAPVFIYFADASHSIVPFWCELSRKEYEENDDGGISLRNWELQERFRQHASQYTKVLGNGKWFDMKMLEEQQPNHEKDIFVGNLRASIDNMAGVKYAFTDAASAKNAAFKESFRTLFLFVTDDYLKSHKMIDVKNNRWSSEANDKPMPKDVVAKLETEYGQKCKRSHTVCSFGGNYVYGLVQFEPKDEQVVALEVLTDGTNVYSVSDSTSYDQETGEYSWNVDDEGIYLPTYLDAVFEGKEGLELYFMHYAPESTTVGKMHVVDGKLVKNVLCVFYVYPE